MVKQHICPICGKQTDNEKYRPFCSKRCADIDLGHWFNGSYVISSDTSEKPDTEETIYSDNIKKQV